MVRAWWMRSNGFDTGEKKQKTVTLYIRTYVKQLSLERAHSERTIFCVTTHLGGLFPVLLCVHRVWQNDHLLFHEDSVLLLTSCQCILVGGLPRRSRCTQANKSGPCPPKVNSAAPLKSSPMANWLFKQPIATPVLPKHVIVQTDMLANCASVGNRH